MQDINELVLLLQQHALHALQQPALSTALSPTSVQFYERLSLGKYRSDAEALADLYPGGEAHLAEYEDLKLELRNYLSAQIESFNARLETSVDYQYVHREVHKQWLVVRFFTGQNAHSLGLPLALQLLNIAKKFDFTQLCIDITAFLRIQYCLSSHYDVAACKEAIRKHQYFRAQYAAEYLAEERYVELNMQAAKGTFSQQKISLLAAEASAQIAPELRKFKSYKLAMFGYLLQVLQHRSNAAHQDVLNSCAKAIRLFKNKPYEARVPLQIFSYMQLIAQIQLQQLKPGLRSANYCLEQVQEGTFNWFKFRELSVQLLLHTRQYSQAVNWYNETLGPLKTADLPEPTRDTWRLFKYYLHALHRAGIVKNAPDDPLPVRFSSSDIPVLKKEDTGIGTAWMICSWLQLLERQNYEEWQQLAGRLKTYSEQYLNKAQTKRSYYFLQLLQAVSTTDLPPSPLDAKAATYLAKLKKLPVQIGLHVAELELIPYEDLWRISRKMLLKAPGLAKP